MEKEIKRYNSGKVEEYLVLTESESKKFQQKVFQKMKEEFPVYADCEWTRDESGLVFHWVSYHAQTDYDDDIDGREFCSYPTMTHDGHEFEMFYDRTTGLFGGWRDSTKEHPMWEPSETKTNIVGRKYGVQTVLYSVVVPA